MDMDKDTGMDTGMVDTGIEKDLGLDHSVQELHVMEGDREEEEGTENMGKVDFESSSVGYLANSDLHRVDTSWEEDAAGKACSHKDKYPWEAQTGLFELVAEAAIAAPEPALVGLRLAVLVDLEVLSV